ncbi:hypothetical protein C8R44DRAFT_882540 [Mycena epipterygia]|nr:hypothetical protein C8R44DRAFT_882540 [Mycena epipterygia]
MHTSFIRFISSAVIIAFETAQTRATVVTKASTTVIPSIASSCTDIQINDTLDLDKRAENSRGTLKCARNGGFSSSCSGCSIHGTSFGCLCAFPDGQSSGTVVDIDPCVANSDGQLAC